MVLLLFNFEWVASNLKSQDFPWKSRFGAFLSKWKDVTLLSWLSHMGTVDWSYVTADPSCFLVRQRAYHSLKLIPAKVFFFFPSDPVGIRVCDLWCCCRKRVWNSDSHFDYTLETLNGYKVLMLGPTQEFLFLFTWSAFHPGMFKRSSGDTTEQWTLRTTDRDWEEGSGPAFQSWIEESSPRKGMRSGQRGTMEWYLAGS